ncbi:MAG: hypothetical protein WCL18_00530 [bacterium]
MRKTMRSVVEGAIMIVVSMIFSVLTFVDDYLLVSPIIWVERSGRAIFYSALMIMIVIGGACICQALGPHAGFHSLLNLLAGSGLFLLVLLGFWHHKKLWSLL